jgi:hypothetical protein
MPVETVIPIAKRLAAPAPRENQRHEPGDHRGRRHEDRPQPYRGRVLDRRAPVEVLRALQFVREAHHQDPVLGNQADQRHEPDLRIDVQRREAEVQRHQRAAHRQRHRHEDHQRIAQALELRGEHQKDHDEREHERDRQPVAFLHVLPRFAEPVDLVAGRQRLFLQKLDRLPHRHARRGHRRQGRRVHLIELRERVGLAAVRHAHDGRQRHHLAAARLHVVAVQHVRRQALGARDLRNHVVRAAVVIEAVHVVLAHEHRERIGDVLHRHAERIRLVAVDRYADRTAVERQIAVDHREQPALRRGRLQFFHRREDAVEIGGRAAPSGSAGRRSTRAATAAGT